LEIVLGASMAPATIRIVLIEGENADGVTVDEDNFDLDVGDHQSTLSGPDQLIAAILGTRQGAIEAGYQLTSIGVTWTDHRDAAALATALAARKIDNVMLVSAFLAAAALAQTVGDAMDYEYIAMLFVEPSTATLALIDSADGSVTDVQRLPLRSTDRIAELASMIAGLDAPETDLEGLFVVGCGVDIVPIKPAPEAVSRLPVSAPEELDMALARGAALASANAPLFASSTAALAYAQDPGTGEIDPYAVSPGHLEVPIRRPGVEFGEADLAYSAAPDEEADAPTGVAEIAEIATEHDFEASQRRRPLLLVGSALAVVFVSAALALEIALALGIRPAVALRPVPGEALIAPVTQAPSPPAAQLLPGPAAGHSPARTDSSTASAAHAGSRADRTSCTSACAGPRRTRAGAGSRTDACRDSRAVLPRPIWFVEAATQFGHYSAAVARVAVAGAVAKVAVAGADARAVAGADARALTSGARAAVAATRVPVPAADELPGARGSPDT